jgi:3-hydroxyisobutyrate dehydrogenase-like beta-hydroxyacid dehydrogenase
VTVNLRWIIDANMRIGVLHPGEMGVSVAQALKDAGHDACWVADGRSPATCQRAAGFTAFDTLTDLLANVEAVVSVCPPHAALAQAEAVIAGGFTGLYVDANAVAPSTAAAVAALVGDKYVDGGIVGPPAIQAGTTRLYLSGSNAAEVAQWFAGSLLLSVVMAGGPTSASALKMAYAAYTKGSSALLLAVNAYAEQAGVRDVLQAEWDLSQPGLVKRSQHTASGTSRKAWRFVGEMEEIAKTFGEAGLPDNFHKAAAELYASMASLKDLPPSSLEAVLEKILQPK